MRPEFLQKLLCRSVSSLLTVTLLGDVELLSCLSEHMCRVPRLVVMMTGDICGPMYIKSFRRSASPLEKLHPAAKSAHVDRLLPAPFDGITSLTYLRLNWLRPWLNNIFPRFTHAYIGGAWCSVRLARFWSS